MRRLRWKGSHFCRVTLASIESSQLGLPNSIERAVAAETALMIE